MSKVQHPVPIPLSKYQNHLVLGNDFEDGDIDHQIEILRVQKQRECISTQDNNNGKSRKIGISALQSDKIQQQQQSNDAKLVNVGKLPTHVSTIQYKLKQEQFQQLPENRLQNLKENSSQQDYNNLIKQLKHKHQTGTNTIQNQHDNIQVSQGVTMQTKFGVQRQLGQHSFIANDQKKYSLAEYRAMKEKEGGLKIQNLQATSNSRKMVTEQDSYSDIFDSTNTIPQSAHTYASFNQTPHMLNANNKAGALSKRSETEVIHKVTSSASINLLVSQQLQPQQFHQNAMTSFLPTRKNQQSYFQARGQSIDTYHEQHDKLNSYILQNISQNTSRHSNRNANAVSSFNNKRATPLILSATNNLTGNNLSRKMASNRIRK